MNSFPYLIMTLIFLLFLPIIAVVDYRKRKDELSHIGRGFLVLTIVFMFVFWLVAVGGVFLKKNQISEYNMGLKNHYTVYLNGTLVEYPDKLKNIERYEIKIDHTNNEIILNK